MGDVLEEERTRRVYGDREGGRGLEEVAGAGLVAVIGDFSIERLEDEVESTDHYSHCRAFMHCMMFHLDESDEHSQSLCRLAT